MVFFFLFIIFWIVVFAEAIIQGRFVKKAKEEKNPFQYVLGLEQVKVLSVLLGIRAFIVITQLFIGPLIDGLSISFTLLAVLGAEVFGMGFGGLVTISSVRMLVHTRRNTVRDMRENSIILSPNYQPNKKSINILFPILSGIVIGVLLLLLKGVLDPRTLLLLLGILMGAVFLIFLVDYLLSKKG